MSAATAMKPCPPWCTSPADHNAEDWAADHCRIHWPPINSTHLVIGFDDSEVSDEFHRAWACELMEVDLAADDPAEVAAGLRSVAAEILRAAKWLETMTPDSAR